MKQLLELLHGIIDISLPASAALTLVLLANYFAILLWVTRSNLDWRSRNWFAAPFLILLFNILGIIVADLGVGLIWISIAPGANVPLADLVRFVGIVLAFFGGRVALFSIEQAAQQYAILYHSGKNHESKFLV